ncbi:LacI family DNA-binding transcriptional regulator [Actinoplanes sp. NPDC051861]|uniref:LacI family DNA-binding transcriptional regulator n=1 Tax=Actinoplanes sp. NPDC051861 TaxID=3155170 RepID=UPI003435C3E2
MSQPSIRDVAAMAGVSYQTVSRVLNDSPRVRPETRQHVLDVIDRLGYRPNRAARALNLGRAGAVTVLTSDTVLYGYARLLQGIEEAARVEGLPVGIRVIESGSPADVRSAADYVGDASAGGVIVVAFDPAGAAVLRALPGDVPAVAATEAGGLTGVARRMIYLDERPAAREATRHLLSLGHRTVHHVAIPSETGTMGRQAGWRDALAEAGIPAPPVVAAGWDVTSAFHASRDLATNPSVTAILCGNDDIALAVRRALHEAGRDVPGDVSIVGFDDVPGCAYWTPALTTVRMNFVGLGHACVAAVAAEIHGLPHADPVLEEPQLIIRESSGAAGQRARRTTIRNPRSQ